MKFFFSVIRVLPDVLRGEFANVGVALASADDSIFVARFLPMSQWRPISRFTSLDYGIVDAIRADMDRSRRPATQRMLGPGLWTVGELVRTSEEWSGTVQLTMPRPALADNAETLLGELFVQYVQRGHTVQPDSRDKNWLRGHVVAKLRSRLEPPDGREHWPTIVQSPSNVMGRKDVHRFDLAIQNGRVRHLMDFVSFEIASRDQLRETLDAKKWAIADTRDADRELPISVLMIGESAAPRLFSDARRVYRDIGAEVVAEEQIDEFVEASAARAIALLD